MTWIWKLNLFPSLDRCATALESVLPLTGHDEQVARGILDAVVDKIMGGNVAPLLAYLEKAKAK